MESLSNTNIIYMKSKIYLLLTGFLALTIISVVAMKLPDILDYLSIGKQVNFNNEKYDLKWSSHPNDDYYKQEYLKRGEELNAYHNMLLFEAIWGNLTINDAVKSKVQELETRKSWDYVANYKVYENKNKPLEAIIDFVISDTMTTYEWNLYRYQKQNGAMILFAYSYRDSLNDDNDLKIFFDRIKQKRIDLINELQAYSIPIVKIGK